MDDSEILRERLLEFSAGRARQRPQLLGSALAEYQELENLDTEGLLTHLEIEAVTLRRLALCKRPLPGSATFAADVQAIARHFNLNLFKLGNLLRQVAAQAEAGGPISQAYLMAARDREDDNDEPTEPGQPNE